MGQFSWITLDTKEAVREKYGCRDQKLTTAYLHDNKGNVWEENEYEGYGVFGGKDYYLLICEMNGLPPDRGTGIHLEEDRAPGTLYPNITRHKEWAWINKQNDNDPNQGWGEEN